MSAEEVKDIQRQLRLAIQTHQMLVAQRKADPLNKSLITKLRANQHQIKQLSDRQRELKSIPGSTSPSEIRDTNQHIPNALSDFVPSQQESRAKTTPTYVVTTLPTATLPGKLLPKAQTECHTKENEVKSARTSAATAATPNAALKAAQLSAHRPSILQGRHGRQSLVQDSLFPRVMCGLSKPEDIKYQLIDEAQLKPEEREKMEYMAGLNLITHDSYKEILSRRRERRRRTTANPSYSVPQRKRMGASSVAMATTLEPRRPRGRPRETPSPEEAAPRLTEPSVATTTSAGLLAQREKNGHIVSNSKNSDVSDAYHIVHSYITTRTAKEAEKKKLVHQNEELLKEHHRLETQSDHVSSSLESEIKRKEAARENLEADQNDMNKLKKIIVMFSPQQNNSTAEVSQ